MTGNAFQSSATPASEPPRGCFLIGLLTAGRLFVHFVAAMTVALVLCKFYPILWRVFVDDRMEISAITKHVTWWSYAMINHYFLIIPAFVVIDGAILAALESRSALRGLARVWFATVLLAAIGALAYVNAASAAPFLIKAMSDFETVE